MMAICEITDGNDYIIEGYQVEPALVARLVKKYGKERFSAVFLTKLDTQAFLKDLRKSTTPNDWILSNTKNTETFLKIANMVQHYSDYFQTEAEKHGFTTIDLSRNFASHFKKALRILHTNN